MGKKVLISYAREDKDIADRICAYLEISGVDCWIAPRDILPGSDWSEAIVKGLETVSVVVLVFSASTNASKHVPREVERADSKNKTLIPFMIDDVAPKENLEYYLGPTQSIQAFGGSVETYFPDLLAAVRTFLDRAGTARAAAPTTLAPARGDEDLIALARSICRNIHEELSSPERSVEDGFTISEPKPGQVVKFIDMQCNKLARKTVELWSHRHARQVLLVGEDLAAVAPSADRPPVICCLDSLDGTQHWLRSRNLYCTALSLFERGPNRDDRYQLRVSAVQTADGTIFLAREDKQATFVDDNLKPVSIPENQIDELGKAQVCTVARRPAHYKVLVPHLSKGSPFQGLYNFGGNPIFCELTLGRYDAVFQPDASIIGDSQEIWDWLPGGHIVYRAGGYLVDLQGQSLDVIAAAQAALEGSKTDFPYVAATNPKLAAAIVDWLTQS